MAKDNMGIEDAEFTAAGKKITKYANKLDERMETFIKAINCICEEGIQDQLIRSRLSQLCDNVERLREPLNSITSQAAKDCKSFVKKIDEADQFLY